MPTFESLEKKVLALATRTVIMPVEEIRLEVKLSELPGVGRRIKRLLAWTEHENFHVRRVGYHVIRRAKLFRSAGVTEALLRGLSDAEGWVRYDAAWALKERGLAEPAVLAALKRLAGKQKPVSDDDLSLDIDDDVLMARVQAANALTHLKALAKKPAR
ncbi:MAG: HEAT repeat domain-containing protein [Myxococcaceae bacterium]|nr:HEAT repeat domain-containing protein [Myxococcaceae bacterium]